MAVNFIDEAGSDLNKFIMTRADGTEETVYLRRDATITQVGTPLNAENLNKLQSDMLAAIAAQAEAVYYGVCSAYTEMSAGFLITKYQITTNLDNFDKTKVSVVCLTSTLKGFFAINNGFIEIRNSKEILGRLIVNNKNFIQMPTNATIVCLWDKTYFRVLRIDGEYSIDAYANAIYYGYKEITTSSRSGSISLTTPEEMRGVEGARFNYIATPVGISSTNSFIGGCVYNKSYCWYGNSEDDKVMAVSYIASGQIQTYSL